MIFQNANYGHPDGYGEAHIWLVCLWKDAYIMVCFYEYSLSKFCDIVPACPGGPFFCI